jgi:hypothetical protein
MGRATEMIALLNCRTWPQGDDRLRFKCIDVEQHREAWKAHRKAHRAKLKADAAPPVLTLLS